MSSVMRWRSLVISDSLCEMECAASSTSILPQWSTHWNLDRGESYGCRLKVDREDVGITPIPRSGLVQFRLWKYFHSRKNALYYRTLNGAQVGDLFMSLIH